MNSEQYFKAKEKIEKVLLEMIQFATDESLADELDELETVLMTCVNRIQENLEEFDE